MGLNRRGSLAEQLQRYYREFHEGLPNKSRRGTDGRRRHRVISLSLVLTMAFQILWGSALPLFASPAPPRQPGYDPGVRRPRRASQPTDPLVQKVLGNSLGSVRPALDLPEGANLDGLVPDNQPSEVAQVDPSPSPSPDTWINPSHSPSNSEPGESPTPSASEEPEHKERTKFDVPNWKPPVQEWGEGVLPSASNTSVPRSNSDQHSGSNDHANRGSGDGSGGDDSSLRIDRRHGEDHDNDTGGEGNHHRNGYVQLAFLSADPSDPFPTSNFSRITEPNGSFYAANQTGGKYQAYSNDYEIAIGNTFKSLAQEETIAFDVYAPSGAVTQNKNGRKAAASVVYHYKANNAISTSALDSNYCLDIKVFNSNYPSGHVVFSQEEPQFLSQLKASARVAMRDQGDWTVNVTRNGKSVSSDTITISDQTASAGWQRKVNGAFKAVSDTSVPYQNDEDVQYSASYPIPAYTPANGTQKFEVAWDLQSPDAQYNRNRRGKFWSLKSCYTTDGSTWNVTTTVADSIYRSPRIFQTSAGNGTLPALNLSYGQGLPVYGSWSFTEKVGSASSKTSTIGVRELDSSVKLVTPGLYVEKGASVPFQLSFNAYPSSWTPGNLSWTLKLVDSKGTALRTYAGNISNNTAQSQSWIQNWDGLTDDGSPAPLGVKVNPVFSVAVPQPPQPAARQQSLVSRVQAASASTTVSTFPTYRYTAKITSSYNLASQQALVYYDFGARIAPSFRISLPVNPSLSGFSLDELRSDGNGNYYTTPGLLTNTTITAADYNYSCDGNGDITINYNSSVTQFYLGVEGNLPGVTGVGDDNVSANVTDNLTGESYQVKGATNLTLQPPQSDHDPTHIYLGQYDPNLRAVTQYVIQYTGSDPQTTGYGRFWPINFTGVVVVIVIFDVQSTNQGDNAAAVIYTDEDCSLCNLSALVTQVLKQIGLLSSPIPIEVSNASGRYRHGYTDLAIATKGLPLGLSRSYSSEEQKVAPRFGWNWNFQDRLTVEPNSGQVYHINEPTTDIYTKQGSAFQAADASNTDRLTALDATHYQILTKSHLKKIYEAVNPSTTLPFDLVLKQQIDPNGNTNTFTWSSDGKRLLKMEGPDPSQYIKLTWSSDRGPDKATDHTGRSVVYRYRAYDQDETECRNAARDYLLAQVVQPGNKVYEHGYHQVLGQRNYQLLTTKLNGILQEKSVGQEDQTGVLQEVTHLEGATMSFARDNSGTTPTTTVTYNAPSGMPQGVPQVWKYNLDAFDRVQSAVDPSGRTASVQYDANHNPTSSSDPLGHHSSQTYDARNNVLTSTDNEGRTTTFTYDSLDNPTSVQLPDGSKSQMTYDANSNLLSITDPLGHKSTLTYTSFGKPQTATDNLNHSWSFSYNSLGFLNGKTAPPASTSQPAAHWTYSVDNLGRRIKAVDPLGRESKYCFDERDRLIDTSVPAVTAAYRQECLPEGHVTARYDNNDLLLATKALDGLVTTYDYDPAQRLIAVHKPGTTKPTTMAYDAMEHVVKMTNSNGASTTYQYDVLNRAISMTYPGGSSESYQYDQNSHLASWNRGSYSVGYTYDDLDRLTNINSPATHDAIALSYDQLDRVASMADNSGTTTYSYTPNYLLQSVTHPGNKTLTYSYDLGDRLSQVLDPEGLTSDYTYSNRNELNTLTHDGKTVSFVHDLLGRTTQVHMPNGVDSKMAYSERNQLLFKEYDKGSSPLITLKYAFNQVGQRVAGEQIDPTGSTLHRYGYNDRRELVASSLDGPRGAHSGIEYALDQNDNITNNNGTSFTSNAADQLTKAGASSLSYNSAGQATSVAGQSLTFAYNDQIKAITGQGLNAQYLYDGNGQRVQKTVNGVAQKFLWNGGSIAKEYKADGSVRADYQLGAGAKIDGKWQFYLSDIQGSTLGVADDTGKVIATWAYSDYGVTTQTSGDKNLYQPFLYTHSELDAETGLYHNKARHYGPKYGKFLSRDPIANSNLYSYCNGDPINRSDPSGQWWPVIYFIGETIETVAVLNEEGQVFKGTIFMFVSDETWGALAAMGGFGAAGTFWVASRPTPAQNVTEGEPVGGDQSQGMASWPQSAGTSGGNPFLTSDPYSPESVDARTSRPPYEPNPQHVRGHGGRDEPCDAASTYATSTRTNWHVYWGQGQNGMYRFFYDNTTGVSHYSGTFPANSPTVPNEVK